MTNKTVTYESTTPIFVTEKARSYLVTPVEISSSLLSQDDIDRINSVMATIDLDGVNKNFEQDARIHAYDRSGEEVDVEIIPKIAIVIPYIPTKGASIPFGNRKDEIIIKAITIIGKNTPINPSFKV